MRHALGLTCGLIAALALACPLAASPESFRPTAALFELSPLDAVDLYVAAPFDRDALRVEDAQREMEGLPPRFALPEEVRITPADRGSWEPLSDGRMVWRLRVGAPGAASLNLGFTRFRMPPGGRLLVYSADQKHVVRPFTAEDNEAHGELWTPVVPGWDLVVEVTLPEAERPGLELELGSVNQGYRGFGLGEAPESGSCNMDVACLTGDAPWSAWREVGQAVGVISTGGSTFCTGSLLNNTAQDKKMLFMTANHCGINSGNASSLVVYWNYENSTCRLPGSSASGQAGDGQLTQFHTGSIFRAAYSSSDFTLVELDDPPVQAFGHYWAGWDRTPYAAPGGPGNGDHACGPAPAALCAAIHHPDTDEKRITFVEVNTTTTSYNNPAIPGNGTHVHAYWDPTPIFPPNPAQAIPPQVTEPGSSGSPLYNAARRFLGQLHGGPSACGATGEDLSDYYGRLSISWDRAGSAPSNRAKDWLDPLGLEPLTLDGRPDCTPPPAPAGLTATPNGDNRVDLAWNPSAGATSYRVFRAEGTCAAAGAFLPLASGVAGTTYTDLTVSGGTTYAYRVSAVDDLQPCESPQSACDDAAATGLCLLAPTFAGLQSATNSGTPTCGLDLSWSPGASRCGGGVVYNVYRGTDPAFVPGPGNLVASCLAATTFHDLDLFPATTYHYVVRAEDGSGNGSGSCAAGNEEENLERRSAAPTGPDADLFLDDMEGGTALWTTDGGTGDWALVTSSSHSPTHSWFVPDPSDSVDRRLRLASPLALPAAAGLKLEFWHLYDLETGWDGGVLEWSLDGSTWYDILGGGGGVPADAGRLVAGGYPRSLNSSSSNPLSTRPAWTGDSAVFVRTEADLADFADRTVTFRWRFASDSSVSDEGWYVDDVRVFYGSACSSATYLFVHGFEAGSLAGWSGTFPPQ
ncbi:MAG: fibronectin type III domain-containing protein [Thermoanaerobaculia bacterium]|nr:fibronectin type III domain-containing protein [Thermoanaerobaculia bacterium]